MNDRFSAKLRRHLLETADDHPAYGQLDSVIEGVASTAQRHPLLARLTWDLGRFGPLPAAAVRYGLIVVALALAAGAGATLGGAGALGQPSTVFEGTWITVDPADGSGMTLVVGPGTTPDVYFEDGYATGLACANDVVKRFTARGIGQTSADRLVATFPDGGGCGLMTVGVTGVYDHGRRDDGLDDTLTDEDGVVWTRALGEQQETQTPETPAPTPETPAPTPETPVAETPAAETPLAETPAAETPAAETPLVSPLPESTPDTPMPTIPPG